MDAKLETGDKLSAMRALLRARIDGLEPPFPLVVLFFSVSDGGSRARVVNASGGSLEAAWQKGLAALRELMKGEQLAGRWIRVDWVERAERTDWRRLRGLLAKTKRNYFRYGIALDPELNIAFTELELNANAVLYGGNTIAHAVFNQKNFLTYAQARYPGLADTTFADDADVYLFSTRGVFCDEAGNLHELNGAGLDAGRRNVKELTANDVTALVRDASAYLARQVDRDGTFVYGYHPCFDRRIAAYNTLRHASTTYAMVEAWEVTRDARLKAAIDRSLKRLCVALIQTCKLPDGTEAAFLVDVGNEVKLGGNAVAILALAKYAAVTGTKAYHATMERLALGIRHMQDQETGAFSHVLNFPDLSVKHDFRTIYYEGEAAFGLMRLYGLTRDPRWLETVERAFEHFIRNDHWKHHDHWLSYCVNELTRYRPEERYFRFGISNVAGYLDFVSDRITTFPTLLELMMAARETLARVDEHPELHHLFAGIDLERFEAALEKRAHYLLNGHFWPELAMFFRKPDRVVGSFFIRHHAFRVRIDDVEHYLSGFVAYRRYLEERAGFRNLVRRHGARSPGIRELPVMHLSESQHPGVAGPASSAGANWSADEVAEVTRGRWIVPPDLGWSAGGLCIHAPTMRPGDMVVVRGQEAGSRGMSAEALRKLDAAPAAIITSTAMPLGSTGVPVLQVDETSAAILAMGRYARDRLTGKVLAVTGSAGKTTAVAMLAHVLSDRGEVGRTAHNANLPHGVAWNLASMPPKAPHVVLELAIGQMGRSARMARPNVALFTNVFPAHLGDAGSSVRDIARTKSAIFSGMSPGDVAVINRDMLEWETVYAAARNRNLEVLHYGLTEDSDFQLLEYDHREGLVRARIMGRNHEYRLGAPGKHMALNSLGIVAAVTAVGVPLEDAFEQFGSFQPLSGRGEEFEIEVGGKRIAVIDDAYNANPGSMTVALEQLGASSAPGRKIAVLGEMAELGPQAKQFHSDLAALVSRLEIDRFFVTGRLYDEFWERLPTSRRGGFASSLDELWDRLHDGLEDGDTVLFKGSNSTGIHRIVARLKENAQEVPAVSVRNGMAVRSAAPQLPDGVSAVLYEEGRDRLVFARGEADVHPPASITKLLTLCLVEEKIAQFGEARDAPVRVSETAANVNSRWGFSAGEQVGLETLMRAAAVVSSNEAAHALAEWHSGSVERFTVLLNARAAELGMSDTFFATPSGLGARQRTTARDVLILARHVLDRHPRVVAMCAGKSFQWNGRLHRSTNRLLNEIDGADGLKTGTLAGKGHHLVFSALQGEKRRIAIVLGAPTKPERDRVVKALMTLRAS